MNKKALIEQIRKKKSVLCVGLDTDIRRIPAHLLKEEDPVFAFNKAIIDATKEFAVSYKINTAFYESQGIMGWQAMQKTLDYIPSECFTIADAKRGDIGNTSHQYARAFFETLNFDAVTVAPYMGKDSVQPFLEYPGKWAIVLGLTSNAGSADFQLLQLSNGKFLYQQVLETVSSYGTDENIMFVIGATQVEQIKQIRALIPNHFLLVPGVGAQGGDLEGILSGAANSDAGLLINVSRGIIYADSGENFAEAARNEAEKYQRIMSAYL